MIEKSGFDFLEEEKLNSNAEESLKREISELSKSGYQLLKENNITDAEITFMKILEKDPENNYAFVGLGDATRKKKDYKTAIDYYQKCLEKYPDNNYALFGLADCYKSMNQYKLAIAIWEQYLKHDDKNITVLTRIADAYRKVRNFSKSKELYLQVLEMEENNAYALIGLGHLHFDFKFYTETQYYLKKMLEINEHVDIRVLTTLGNCHRKLKTFEQGVPYFQRALEIEPRNFYALFGIANCYRGLNMHKEALENWLTILQFDPNNKVILTRAGDSYRNLDELDLAEDYYKKALNIEFDVYAILGLALINKSKGKYSDAVESLEALLKHDSKNYRLYVELLDCYTQLKDKTKITEILAEYQRNGLKTSYISQYLDNLDS